MDGNPEMTAAWREILNAWDDLSTIAVEFRELDDERILVHPSTPDGEDERAGARRRGAEGSEPGRDPRRKVVRLTAWWSRDRAYADLGL
jgi:hypothetical protein